MEGHVPYAPRVVGSEPGWTRVVLVQTVAGPLAGDHTAIEVELGPGAALELGTNAATLAYPAGTGARQSLRVVAAEGSRLAWRPASLILAAGCDLESIVELELEEGAAAYTREIVVLGRDGEQPGRYRSSIRCSLVGRPLLHEGVDVDPGGIVAAGGAVLAGARAFASLALLGVRPSDPPGPGELDLAGPGRVMRALARGTADLAAQIGGAESAFRRALARPA